MNKLFLRYRLNGVPYAFSVSAPYTEGHLLTPNESDALNVLRSENIREVVRREWDKFVEGMEKDKVLSAEELALVQSRIDEADLSYQFGQQPGRADRLGAIEKEALLLAKVRAPDGASEEEIDLLAQSIDLVAEARERVEIRTKIMASEMEDLLK